MVSISVLSTSPAPRPAAGGAAPASGDGFAQALAGATDADAPPSPDAAAAAERQDIAANGKDLPEKDKDSGDDKADDDEAAPTVDLSWLVPTLPVQPPPVQTAPPTPAQDSPAIAALAPGKASPPPDWTATLAAAPAEVEDDEPTPTPAPAAGQAQPAPVPTQTLPATPAPAADAAPSTGTDAPAAPQTPPAQPATGTPTNDTIDAIAVAVRAQVEAGQPAPSKPAPQPAAASPVAATTPAAPQPTPTTPAPAPATPDSQPVAATQAVATQPAAAQAVAAANTAAVTDKAPTRDSDDDRAQARNGVRSLADATSSTRRAGAPASGIVQPAGQAFAAAISAAARTDRRQARDDGTIDTALAAGSIGAGIAGNAQSAAVDGTTPVIDTRRSEWIEKVIDHIEVLRDAADAADTRIRLVPDALGKIDVAIKHDGDAINVRFSAEQPETRQLLADAQPKLAEIAASRGLRVTQSTIDNGQGNNPQQQQRQPESARQPIANRLSATVEPDETGDSGPQQGWIA